MCVCVPDVGCIEGSWEFLYKENIHVINKNIHSARVLDVPCLEILFVLIVIIILGKDISDGREVRDNRLLRSGNSGLGYNNCAKILLAWAGTRCPDMAGSVDEDQGRVNLRHVAGTNTLVCKVYQYDLFSIPNP